MSAPFNELLL